VEKALLSGREVLFNVTFTSPFLLPVDHYFFVPQVQLASGNFYWLSTARPAPLFPGDLQAWIRNAPLDPDWLRMGTDIVGGTGTFNMAFSVTGTSVPEPATFGLYGLGFIAMGYFARQFRKKPSVKTNVKTNS
jgi:PEP-CTERM motif